VNFLQVRLAGKIAQEAQEAQGVLRRAPDWQVLRPARRFRPIRAFSDFQTMAAAVWCFVALIRILVDGYSLLHNWPELAPGRTRHSAAARDELIQRLTLYQDAIGTPITVFFDGANLERRASAAASTAKVEVLYSRRGQTADQMIERTTHLLNAYGEVLAVTDDLAERETVTALGGLASSCWNFIQSVEDALAAQADEIRYHNRKERHRFQHRV